jgi:putative DNA methylase
LQQPEIAELLVEALDYGDRILNHYRLHAWVVMPNHVHLLISPQTALPKLTHSLKGYTAREANRILGRTGMAFWQKEFFDHWIRNKSEFARVRAYIEKNPVKAGLAVAPELYQWSSAGKEAGQ